MAETAPAWGIRPPAGSYPGCPPCTRSQAGSCSELKVSSVRHSRPGKRPGVWRWRSRGWEEPDHLYPSRRVQPGPRNKYWMFRGCWLRWNSCKDCRARAAGSKTDTWRPGGHCAEGDTPPYPLAHLHPCSVAAMVSFSPREP